MGSKTYFSIPQNNRPLKNRLNLVLTNNSQLLLNSHNHSNLIFFNFDRNKDIIDNNYNNESYKLVKLSVLVKNSNYSKKEIFIIGGEKIYNTYLDLMNTMNYFDLQMKYIYLTYINKNYKCDTFFPK